MLEIRDKKVAVIGLGKRTGVASARMLAEHGANVIASDVKSQDQLKEEISMLEGYKIDFELDGHGPKCLESDLIVVSPGVPLNIPFFKKVEEKGIPVISEVELAYQFTKARIIAITGTNGKTTTTSLLGHILKKSDLNKVKVAGNIGTPLIQEVIDLSAEDWVVAEISSFQLETIKDFKPDISLYLNFTPDHLDRHQTVENYWQAKKKIFMNQTEEDYAIINFDDEKVVKAGKDCKAEIFGVSLKGNIKKGIFLKENNLYIIDPANKDNMREITDNGKKIISTSEIPLIGQHNVQNTAFAILAAYLVGVSIDIIREGIETFNPVDHRLQKVGEFDNGIVIIDDSKATNPDAAVKAMESFKQPIVLIAGGQDRDADFGKMAEAIRKKVKSLILLGETKDKLEETVLNTGFENIYKVKDMSEAVKIAKEEVSKGDCLLLSPGCPSWDMYPSYKKRGNDFKKEVEKYYPL